MRVLVARDSVLSMKQKEKDLKALNNYPAVPLPSFKPDQEGTEMPEDSGVYSLWNRDGVEYVGQSRNLKLRLRLGQHHRMQADDFISYVLLPIKYLLWAECYYIGLLRPERNSKAPVVIGEQI